MEQQVFISMIRSKMPSEVLLQLELLKGAGEKWTVQRLREMLRQYMCQEKGRKDQTRVHVKPEIGTPTSVSRSENK